MTQRSHMAPEQQRPERSSGNRPGVPNRRGTAAHGRYRGRHEQAPTKGEKRRLWQLTISGILLVVIITAKLVMPQQVEEYRDKLMGLLGKNTDFVAAFSSVGRTFSGEGTIGEALNDAYTAVFGPQETAEQTAQELPEDEQSGQIIYSAENIPENASLFQEVLGFAYTAPVAGTLTSSFGYRNHPVEGENKFHYGLDLAADAGTVIVSFADGIVNLVGESSDLGKYVMVSHSNGYTSLYAHCSRITASSGQTVKMGDPIAEVGQTGEATGNHLHFELHQGDRYLNPIYYV